MKYVWLLIWSLVIVAPAWAFTTDGQEDKCAAAAVVYCDNWEAHALSVGASDNTFWHQTYYKQLGYVLGTVGSSTNASVVADPLCRDTRCFRMTYAANSSGQNIVQDYGIGSGFPFGRSNYYMRWWENHSVGFKYSSISTKIMAQRDNDFQQVVQFDCMTSMGSLGIPYTGPCEAVNVLLFATLSFPPPNDQQLGTPQNIAQQAPQVGGTPICYEVHVIFNSTQNSFDGLSELYVNDVLVSRYANINVSNRIPGPSKITGVDIAGFWNCSNGQQPPCTSGLPQDTHAVQYRYIDNLMIKDGAASPSPIGCATTVVDTTPPAPPTNVRVQ